MSWFVGKLSTKSPTLSKWYPHFNPFIHPVTHCPTRIKITGPTCAHCGRYSLCWEWLYWLFAPSQEPHPQDLNQNHPHLHLLSWQPVSKHLHCVSDLLSVSEWVEFNAPLMGESQIQSWSKMSDVFYLIFNSLRLIILFISDNVNVAHTNKRQIGYWNKQTNNSHISNEITES